MILKNAKVWLGESFHQLDIRIDQGRIAEIGENLVGQGQDLSGKMLLPGLVDVHSHGCIGYDFSTATVDEMQKMCRHYAERGVTSVLATTMTNPLSTIRTAMKNVRTIMEEQQKGTGGAAHVLGVNMEGPFLGVDKKGAHDPQYLLPPDESLFEELYALSGNKIRLTDIDPTLPGGLNFIRKYHDRTKISLAHTSCDYELAQEAVKAGATEVTHLFNAMDGLHHRRPGLIGAVSDFPLYAEIICDGIHVHPSVIRMMFRLTPQQMLLISDSMCAAGLSDGEYELGGLQVFVKDGHANLQDGTIAGSTITVYDGLVNALKFGVPLEIAVASATSIPADAIGCGDIAGKIAVGRSADLLIMEEDISLSQVYCEGKRIR